MMMHELDNEFKDLCLKDHIITLLNSLFMIIISYGLDFTIEVLNLLINIRMSLVQIELGNVS